VEKWKTKDPVERLKRLLIQQKHWTESRDQELKEELTRIVNSAIDEAEKLPPPPPETLFEDLYDQEPWNIKEQREEFLAFLRSA
jgi:TPP-dependent pyruvate/acetoin dehydrogenase alpha subunit